MREIEDAYLDAHMGRPSRRPVIEMTLPTSLDTTISPPGLSQPHASTATDRALLRLTTSAAAPFLDVTWSRYLKR